MKLEKEGLKMSILENLDQTIEMMCNPDYKLRFRAEYYQLKA